MSQRRETDPYGNTHTVKQRNQDFEVIKKLTEQWFSNKEDTGAEEKTDELPF
jgi:ABC-type metal ion transport system substrate-binding protein